MKNFSPRLRVRNQAHLVAAPSVRGVQRALGALLFAAAAAMALGQVGLAVAAAPTQAAPSTQLAMAPSAHGGGHGGGHAMGHGLAFSGRGFERLLDEIKATEAQRQQIRQIADKARADVRAWHEEGRDAHQRGLSLWASPKLDAAEAEKVRQQMLAQHDRVSKRIMQATLEVGQVLTPEQRAQAAQIIKQRQEHRAHRERGAAAGAAPQPQAQPHPQSQAAERTERARDHMLRRPVAPAPAPAPAPASTATPAAPAASSR